MAVPKLKVQEVHDRFNRLRYEREATVRERAPQIAFSAKGVASLDRASWLGIECIKAAMLRNTEELGSLANELHDAYPDDWQEQLNLATTFSLVGDVEGVRKSARLALESEDVVQSYAVMKLAAAMLDIGMVEDAAEVMDRVSIEDMEPGAQSTFCEMKLFAKRWLERGLDSSILTSFIVDSKTSLKKAGWAFPTASFESPPSDIGEDLPVGVASFLVNCDDGLVVDVEEELLLDLEKVSSEAYIQGLLTAYVEDVSEQ